MTDRLDTEAIAARLKNATPGPWKSDGRIEGWWSGERPAVRVGHSVPDRPGLSSPLCMVGADNKSRPVSPEADAEFIAHAPGDIAALLAEVARLKAEIEAEHLIREAAIAAQDSAMQLVAGLRAALQAVGET